VRGDATRLLLRNGLGALAIEFEQCEEIDDGSYEEFRGYRKAVVVRGRTKCSGMMKCEARLRSCFVGAPHQALAGRRCDWLLIHHMLGVALSSPSDVPRQESRETKHISLHRRHGVCS
jgi:hypothetical protein